MSVNISLPVYNEKQYYISFTSQMAQRCMHAPFWFSLTKALTLLWCIIYSPSAPAQLSFLKRQRWFGCLEFLYKQCTSSLPLFQRNTNKQTIVCWHTIVCLLVLRWKRGRELVHCLYKKLQTCLPTSRRPAKPYRDGLETRKLLHTATRPNSDFGNEAKSEIGLVAVCNKRQRGSKKERKIQHDRPETKNIFLSLPVCCEHRVQLHKQLCHWKTCWGKKTHDASNKNIQG